MFANVDLGTPQTSAKQLQSVAGLVYYPYESMLSLWTLCFTERAMLFTTKAKVKAQRAKS